MQLYALCDQNLLNAHNITLHEYLKHISKYKIKILQYRNKASNINYIKQQLKIIRKTYNGCLIINDYVELVPFCDGLHLGQEDLYKINSNAIKAISWLRQTLGYKKIIGLSTHNKQEVISSNSLTIDYIGLGAYRNTNTKEIDNILGDMIDEIAAISKHKVAAIGGVRLNDRFQNITYLVLGRGLL